MRILHVANFSLGKYGEAYYSVDRKITNGLIRNGHLVYEFSYRDVARAESKFKTTKLGGGRIANQRLLTTASRFQPDLLLLGHSELITVETLKRIRERAPATKIALWYVDPVFHKEAIQHVARRVKCLDTAFMTTSGKWLREFRGPSNTVAFFPNPVDSSMECHQSYNQAHPTVDLLFCGSEIRGSERESMLKQLQTQLTDIRFEIWGTCGQPKITGNDYYRKLSETKMALNFNRRDDVALYSSDRIAQLTGNGVLSFANRIPGFEALYTEEEIVYFDSIADLMEKIRYYHENDIQRRQIASRGWKKAHASFGVQRVTKYMLEVIYEQPFSEPYEWQNERIPPGTHG